MVRTSAVSSAPACSSAACRSSADRSAAKTGACPSARPEKDELVGRGLERSHRLADPEQALVPPERKDLPIGPGLQLPEPGRVGPAGACPVQIEAGVIQVVLAHRIKLGRKQQLGQPSAA